MAKSKFNTKKILIYVGIGVLAYILLRKMRTTSVVTPPSNGNSLPNPTPSSGTPFVLTNPNCQLTDNKPAIAFFTLDLDKSLKRDTPMQTGNEVIWLQKWLFRNGACIEINGTFDDFTKAALLQITGESAITIRDIEQIENSSLTRTDKYYGQTI
jgi:hypothetical protein